ncbi:MAG: Hsp33 family molecular chaperone HslO [Clostridia bacterium]|jgi:molecular chaperone Hsp33|nr:Hsp33 family molecular chaperone HslO [Clostridia bacterium]
MNNNDRIIKFLAYNGRISITCANTTYLVEQARKTHDLSPVAIAALGRVLTISGIMGSNLKQENNKLTIQIKGNGPLGTIVVVANSTPKLKGYVSNPLVDLPLNEEGKLDVGKAVGRQGFLNVIKDIGLKEPYIGMVPLVTGEIAQDFTNYFYTSEQINTAVALGVLVDRHGVKSSGGYVISAMPNATQEDIFILENRIKEAEPISKMLDKNMSLLEIAKDITGDENIKIIKDDIIPSYECDCNKEKIQRGLTLIGKEELIDIINKEGNIETVCHFCNKKYDFKKEELEELIKIK